MSSTRPRRWPTLGELFVLWDGNSIVIKRYQRVWDSEPPPISLHSAGRFHPTSVCLASKARFLGKVLSLDHTHGVTGDYPGHSLHGCVSPTR